jgi:hypothetical protein
VKHYSEAAVERMMKVQEVILRALAGKLRWWEAAEILGVSDRTMRRWRYQQGGNRRPASSRKSELLQTEWPKMQTTEAPFGAKTTPDIRFQKFSIFLHGNHIGAGSVH